MLPVVSPALRPIARFTSARYHGRVMNEPAAPAPLTTSPTAGERALVARWAELRFDPEPLRRLPGGPLTVVFRGWPNSGPGPDFRDAILADARGELRRGDIELHQRVGDWWQHGHQRDPAYNNVILHVVGGPPDAGPVILESGALVPSFVLRPSASDIMAPADSCRDAAAGRTPEDLLTLLDRAGDERFESKTGVFEGELAAGADPGEVIYTGLLAALGYAANVRPMRDLAARLPLATIEGYCAGKPEAQAVRLAEGLLLGAAGLLPAGAHSDTPAEEYLTEIYTVTGSERLAGLTGGTLGWTRRGVRPDNTPPRRLAGLARLIARTHRRGMIEALLECLQQGTPEEGARAVEALLTVPPEGFWGERSDYGSRIPRRALIGAERARTMLVDVVLPFARAAGNCTADGELSSRALTVFRNVPNLGSNAVTRRLLDQIDPAKTLRRHLTARRQQGMLHLWRTSCAHRLCGFCPIAGAAAGDPPVVSDGSR